MKNLLSLAFILIISPLLYADDGHSHHVLVRPDGTMWSWGAVTNGSNRVMCRANVSTSTLSAYRSFNPPADRNSYMGLRFFQK